MSKKCKILIEVKDYKVVEVVFPFYAYYQGDGEEIFVKITKNEFKQLIFKTTGEVRIIKYRANNYIASIWLENKSDWKQWQDAVRSVKDYVKSF